MRRELRYTATMKRFAASIFFITACLALISACRPTVDCQRIGCAFGLVCDVETGECVAAEQDCREAPEICSASEICDEQTGECRPRVTQCADSGSCPEGQVCDAQSGTCRAAVRCSVDGCEPQEVCNSATDRCEPQPCLEDLDCPTNSGFICGDSGVCVRGCRPGAASCPQEQTCVAQTGEGVGICQDRCVEDTDCAFGQICVDDGDRTRCEFEPPCDQDEDCRPDEVCVATTCSQPRCTSDDDCASSQICQVASGLCFGGDCEEDQFGNGATRPPNHSRSTAFPLTDSDPELSGLVLCPGRSDWFRLNVRTTEIVSVRASQTEPGPDIDLYVFDERGAIIAADTGLGSRPSLRFDGRSNQFVYLEVRPTGQRTTSYDLEIGRDFCANDTFEENDDYSRATTIPLAEDAATVLDLRACGFDQDWFRLPSIEASNGLRVLLRNGSSDLVAALLTPDGEIFELTRQTSFQAVRIGFSGDYYVRVVAERGQSSDYQLLLEPTSESSCPDANSNATDESATPVGADDPTSFVFCPAPSTGWERDWIELTDAADAVLDAEIVFAPGSPRTEVTLYRRDGETRTPIKSVPSRDGVARIVAQLSVGPDVSYYLRVTSNAARGRILDFPTYDVTYSLSMP